jgi:hypothetical protein
MKLVYSRRALADLDEIASYYAAKFAAPLKLLHAFRNVLRYEWSPSFATRSGFSIGYAATRSIFCTFGIRRDDL